LANTDNDVQISFGANTAGLAAGTAAAKAQLAALNDEVTRIAQKAVASGRTLDVELVGALRHTQSEAASLTNTLKAAGVAIETTGGHARGAGAGLSFYTREARAMADELASGRFRQFDGSLLNFAVHGASAAAAFAAANPVLTAFGLAVAAVGASMAYLTLQEVQATNAANRLAQQANLFGGVKLSDDAIKQYRASLLGLSGVTQEIAEQAVGAFQNMRNASDVSIAAMVADFRRLVQAGVEPKDAVRDLTAAFSNALGPISEIEKLIPTLTLEQRQYIAAAQQTGDVVQAQAAIQKAFAENAAENAEHAITENNKLIASAKEAITANEARLTSFGADEATAVGIDYANAALERQIEDLKQANEQIKNGQEQLKKYSDILVSTQQSAGDVVQHGLDAGEKYGGNKALDALDADIASIKRSLDKLGPAAQSAGQGIATGVQPAINSAAELIRNFEGSGRAATTAYEDHYASGASAGYRIGYGSSTTTDATTGQVRQVTEGMTATLADAEADLARRIVEFQTAAAAKIGPAWAGLSDNVKASITSVAYNYGHVPSNVVTAAKTGDNITIAEAISSLPDTAQHRRAQEAANVTAAPASAIGGTAASASALSSPESAAASAQDAANVAKLNEELAAAQAKRAELLTQQRGATETQKAELSIAQASVSTRQNEVGVAEQKLSAARTDLQTQQSLGASQQVIFEKTMQVTNAERGVTTAKNEQTEAALRLSVAQAKAVNDIAKIHDAELALAAFKTQEAGQDPVRIAQADEQKLAADTAYNNALLAQTTQTQDAIIKKAQETAASQTSAASASLKERNITEKQWLTQVTADLDAEKAAVSAAYDAEIAAAGNNSLKVQEIERQKAQAIAAIDKQMQTDQQQAAEAYTKEWQSATQSINNAITSQVDGLLTHTETFGQAMKKILLDLTEQIIKSGLNSALTGLEAPLKGAFTAGAAGAAGGSNPLTGVISALTAALGLNTGAHTLSTSVQTANTAATTAGTAASVAGTASTDAVAAATLPNTVATIGNTVATQASAITKLFPFATGTPYVPKTMPALVHEGEMILPAAVNPMNPRNRIGSFDTGAWNIPSDQLAYVHKGEMIADASQSAGLRNLIEGSGGASGAAAGGRSSGAVHIHPTTNVNISANDSASVEAWARNNGHVLAKAMEQNARHGAFLGMRRLVGG
jgi:GH24 family phage-related lysozyme (muramidase)